MIAHLQRVIPVSDFATLVMRADATGMIAGHQALDAMAAKGAQAEATVTKAMREVGQSGQQAGRGLEAAGTAAQRTGASMGQAAQQARQAGQEVSNATGHTANLASQFNDIAVMMAAGQNPIQLALQQGTQISQVLIQMGGGVGAIQALGGAFMAMISPVSLATLGIIALGATFSQSIGSLIPETKSFSDAMDDLNDSIEKARSNIDLFADGGVKLAEIYGGVTTEVRDLASAMAQVDLRRMNDAANAAMKSLRSDYNGSGWLNVSRREDMALGLELSGDSLNRMVGLSGSLGGENTLQQNYEILTAMRETLEASLGAVKDMTPAQRDYYAQVVSAEEAARRVLKVTEDTTRAEEGLANAKIAAAYAYAGETMRQGAALRAAADEQISALNEQAEIQMLIARYGADSEEVTDARAAAERKALEATLEAKGITGQLAVEVLAAHDASVAAAGATDDWAAAMARVNAQLAGAMSLLASIGGGMVQRAGINAANSVLDAGGTSIAAEKARRRAEERTRLTNEANTAAGFMSPDMLDANLAEMERQWALQDEYEARLTGVREGERAASRAGRKKAGGGGRKKSDRPNEYQRSVADIQSETEAFLRQADALAQVTAAGGDWERALAVIEEEQKLLNAAQKAGVDLTPQVRAGITEMAEAYVHAEEQLERMREATNKAQDAMEGLFGSITDGADGVIDSLKGILEQIAKVQLATAGIGLLGATSWGSSMMTSLGGLMSFDGGGYTGDGPRSGGVDGKGGFPAIVHPGETITDHTKGQGGAVDVRVFMDEDGAWQARVERISGAVSARTVAQHAEKQSQQQYLTGGR